MSVIATYDEDWVNLSEEHERTEEDIRRIIEKYRKGEELDYHSYTVVGVFGSGKTQLLYHIHEECLNQDILPLYFEADRLFESVFELDDPGPGDITDIIQRKTAEIEEAISENDADTVHELLNPGDDIEKEALADSILENFGGESIEKKAILVDELEQQYESLQEYVRVDENSPLRDWLERGNELKFLALAPAGMYEMGGADRTRCGRIVIPPADIGYLREEFFEDNVGLANACWWLSRGNPRHILSNANALERRDGLTEYPAHEISEFLNGLDPIGQEPSVVPAANLDEVHRGELNDLLDLAPQEAEERRRYVIDVEGADEAEFIERAAEIFDVERSVADYLARYFFLVAGTLSDEENRCYVDELDGLFALAIDFLLEYQHNNPEIKEGIREVTEAYNQLDSNEIDATIGRLFEYKQTTKALPFTTSKIREIFRLPIVDPVVKDNLVKEIREEYEGDGRPLWKISRQNRTVYFFISHRDFESYIQSDEFLDSALPDGHTVLCITADSPGAIEGEFEQWLQNNGKLVLESTSPLLSDFLMSLRGEVDGTPPVDLEDTLDELANSEDPILERKVKIYRESLERSIIGSIANPTTFCDQDAPNTHVWGRDQIGNRDAVIPALAQAYREKIGGNDIERLADLGALFESGGELNFIATSRPGYVTVAGDLLPLHSREYEHQQVIKNLRRYFNNESQLRTLAQLVPEETFRKLSANENKNRLLTAFWRATRGEFDVDDLNENHNWLKKEVISRLDRAEELASKINSGRHDATLDFDCQQNSDSFESYIAAHNSGAFTTLYELTDSVINDGDLLVQKIYSMYLSALRDHDQAIRKLGGLIDSGHDEFENFENAADDLEKNLWEYSKAREFAGITEDEISTIIQENCLTGRIAIDKLDDRLENNRQGIRKYVRDMSSLDDDLEDLETVFDKIASINPDRGEEE